MTKIKGKSGQSGLSAVGSLFSVKLLGTLILLLLLIWVISGKLTRQLTTLALAVARFGKGDLDLTLPISSENAETRLLATAFHQMKLQLQEYIEKLQQETARLGRLEGELIAATQIQMSQPQVEKVFDIIKALSDMQIFAHDQEMDEYLDVMQQRILNGDDF